MKQLVKAAQKLVKAAQADRFVSIDTICADIESLHKSEGGLTVNDKRRSRTCCSIENATCFSLVEPRAGAS